MAKLFLKDLPSEQEIMSSATSLQAEVDAAAVYTNMLFMKVATELNNDFDDVLADYNLSSGRFTLLFLLKNSPEGLMPSELSAKVGVTQATISGLINGLEKMKLVARHSHEKDGRSFVIKITPEGESLIAEIFPRWYPRMMSFWSKVSSDEKSGMNTLLARMIESKGQ
ncbi:Transcriptional repressor MprA [compost metagenome]